MPPLWADSGGRLGSEFRWMMPGYEDIYYYLWKERRCLQCRPVEVEP